MNFHKRASGVLMTEVRHDGRSWPPPPGAPELGALVELARWEWHPLTNSEPWVEVEGFIAGQRSIAGESGLVGFGVLLGHEAAAAALGAPSGWGSGAFEHVGEPAPSPVPVVPGAVVIAYRSEATNADFTSAQAPGIDPSGWVGSWSVREHEQAVEAVRDAIGMGEVYQVNLVSHLSAELGGGPDGADDAEEQARAAAWSLAAMNATHAGSIVGDGWSVHSASPELAVRIRGGVVETEPIKGTLAQSAGGAEALRASAKDRAEHLMIVDLERNDLARVALDGTVEVPDFYSVHAWSGLAHAHSTVRATLRPGVGLADVLRAVLPGGSVTGAPKSSALRLLHELEPVGRGPSMGAMGWITPEGDVELALTIRTIACDHAAGRVHLWAGGGVTWGSTPAGEVAEAGAKAAPILAALARRA